VAAWLLPLSGHRTPVRLVVSRSAPSSVRGGRTAEVQLSTRLPARVKPGRYKLTVCAGRHGGKPRRSGCITSAAFAVITGVVPITIVVGSNPITVSPSLDTAGATSEAIGSAGGTLTATAPDGSRLTLTIPANALAGNEQVTLTPLSSLGGSPVTMIAGAQIDPAGLDLLQAAELVVAPARSVPVAQQVAFRFRRPAASLGWCLWPGSRRSWSLSTCSADLGSGRRTPASLRRRAPGRRVTPRSEDRPTSWYEPERAALSSGARYRPDPHRTTISPESDHVHRPGLPPHALNPSFGPTAGFPRIRCNNHLPIQQEVGRGGLEPPTLGLRVPCSTS
jgi:hypothetical protein